ncbi:MAG: DUF1549 and DUF1553 domain-containing protein [Verrucomicrobiaceae bacterium]|nr:DUF1549 and DUF1553 domain-containing protein [Verrucomicrobiaceae bacterium]
MKPHLFSGILCATFLAALFHAPAAAGMDARAVTAQIDKLVDANLAKQNLKPTGPISDEVFVRRIYLDIAGRIPSIKETTDFLADKSADKRAKLIDHLLDSDGYEQSAFNYWADILRLKSQSVGGGNSSAAGHAYIKWLKDSLAANKPYDQMVRELLTADGKAYENGAIGFYIRDYNMPLDNMAVTTQIFLGTSMVCAQCHNHPFDKWTQLDYYQMAAHSYGMTGTNGLSNPLLAQALYGGGAPKSKKAKSSGTVSKMELPEGVERKDIGKAMSEILRPLRYTTVLDETKKRSLKLPHDYKYEDAKPNQVIEPTIPTAFAKDGKITQAGQQPIDAYAKWLTSKDNPRFTTVIANRLWKKVMGMGLIEPVDQITDSTVPSNPALLTFLENTMKELNYDLKAYLGLLYKSAAYQRAAWTKDVELGDVFHFPGPLVRRMSAEQIWDSMVTLYKPSPDQPSVNTRVDSDIALRKIEWLDRSLNELSPDELKAGAIKVAQVQKQLAADVRKAQEKLTEANKNHDEDAIRAAKKIVSGQRKRIDEAVEDVVFTMGFKKFAELARDGKLKEQMDDQEFAQEIASVIKGKNGADLDIDDALAVVARQQHARITEQQKARFKRDAEQLKVDDDKERASLKAWENYRDNFMIRAADVRSPAPNGHFLREFGQSDRELVENASSEATVGQALMLLNGKIFGNLMNPFTMISRALHRAETPEQTADAIYLALMSRKATDEEKALLRPVIEGKGVTGKGDAFWAVLNTRQFFFIE